VAVFGCLLMSLLTVFAYADSVVTALIFKFIGVIGAPIAMPAVTAIVSLIAPAHRRGAWTGLTIAAQSLGRTVGPPVIGMLYDIDIHSSFLALGFAALCAAVLSALLIPFIPITKKGAVSTAARNASPAIAEEEPATTCSSEVLSEHAVALVAKLRQRRNHYQDKLEEIKTGKYVVPEPSTPEKRREARGELIEWLAELMEVHGYTNWPDHLDGVKLMLFNAFPRLRSSSREDKISDLIRVFEAHIDMAEKTEMFVGAEDLLSMV